MIYMVFGNFEKKIGLFLKNEFRHPQSKISRYFEIRNQSGKLTEKISQQKKVNTISHVRKIEGLTKYN